MMKKQQVKTTTATFPVLSGILLLSFLLFLHFSWRAINQEEINKAVALVKAAQATLDRDLIRSLRATEDDAANPAYLQAKTVLSNLTQADSKIRFAYLLKLIDGKIAFAADSEPTDSPDYSPPGQIYEEAQEEDYRPFSTGNYVVETSKDRWGSFISVLMPITDPQNGHVIAVLGIDYPLNIWRQLILNRMIDTSFLALCIVIALMGIYFFRKKYISYRQERNALSDFNKKITRIHENFRRAQRIAHVGDWEIDLPTQLVYASDEAYRIYGLDQEIAPLPLGRVQSLVLAKDRPHMDAALHTLVRDGDGYDVTYSILKADTQEVRVLHSVAMLEQDEAGNASKIIGVVQDITERRQIEQSLLRSEARFRAIFEQAPIGIGLAESAGSKLSQVNQRFCEIFGCTETDLATLSAFLQELESADPEAAYKRLDKRFVRPGKSDIWVQMTMASVDGKQLDRPLRLCMVEDITERKKAEEALQESVQSKALLLSNLIGMAYRCDCSEDYRLEFVSQGCLELTGYTVAELTGSNGMAFSNLICEQYRKDVWKTVHTATRDKTHFHLEYEIKIADGSRKWVMEKGQAVYDKQGVPVALEGFITDISDRKRREVDMLYLSSHDSLTGVYNRTHYVYTLRRQEEQPTYPLSLIVGDVNGLKLINDTFGHAAGDRVLVGIAGIMVSCCRKADLVFRIGGDEFCIVMPGAGSSLAQSVSRKIQQACSEAEGIGDTPYLSISLGYATTASGALSLDQLMKRAEEMMYRRKLMESKSIHNSILSSIRNTMYEKSMETEEHAERMISLSGKLGRALNLRDEQLFDLELLAHLHDLGKMSVDDRILNKEGPLNEDEWNEMRKHPAIGYRIAHASPELSHIADYILAHHERWDGKGYPQGLAGLDIPLLSRIVAIVDAYDAMTQNRPYRKAMTVDAALAEIRKGKGTQFDPVVSDIFIAIMEIDQIQQTACKKPSAAV